MVADLLLTGGAGFIGVNLVRWWLEHNEGDRIVVLDSMTYAGNLQSLDGVLDDPRLEFVHGDIRDTELVEKLLTENKLDTIVHLAAESHVDRSIEGPDEFIDTNVVGTHSLLKAARNTWQQAGGSWNPHRFHHVSTDEVYGSLTSDDPAFEEETPYAPNSPYSASKAASDHLVRAYHHTFGLQVTTTNCSNNYGPYQFPEKLIPLMLMNILSGKPLPVYGDGMNIRDWLYVDDHCRGIELAIKGGVPGETYCIGGNNERTNIEIVRALCSMVQKRVEDNQALKDRFPNSPASSGSSNEELITYVKDRPGHDLRYAINAEKASRELGYQPAETFESGFGRTVDWYLENETWWTAVMDGTYKDWIETNYESR
jgi:dTDP-glucose 4,6-dehydratase